MSAARLFFAAAIVWTGAAAAAPWRPVDDAVVLAEVPARNDSAALVEAQRAQRARPHDPDLAQRLVVQQLEAGRRYADPRYFGQAEAVLEPFRMRAGHPIGIDVMWADILQHRHDYDAARAVLDAVLSTAPGTQQARLIRAQMNLAQGRLSEARRDCTALLRGGSVGVACLAQVLGMSGGLDRGYGLLLHEAGLDAGAGSANGGDPAVRSWVLTALADMAERRGDATSIDWLGRAVKADPDDQYARLALADAYIDRGDLSAAERAAGTGPRSDAALLRLAIIAARQGIDNRDARELQERLAEAQARGETVHLRDLARFRLQVLKDSRGALTAARENFKTQKEPWDVRILLEAAAAAHDPTALSDFRAWQRATGYQDHRSSPLLLARKEHP